MRLGIIHDWKAHWYTERQFASFLHEDLAIRKHIQKKMGHAGLSTIVIRKDTNKVVIDIHTAKPGIVIGKSGSEVDALRRDIHDMTGKTVHVNIVEISNGTRTPTAAHHRRAARQQGELAGR
jgi:small subunit ribosomal protein S3